MLPRLLYKFRKNIPHSLGLDEALTTSTVCGTYSFVYMECAILKYAIL